MKHDPYDIFLWVTCNQWQLDTIISKIVTTSRESEALDNRRPGRECDCEAISRRGQGVDSIQWRVDSHLLRNTRHRKRELYPFIIGSSKCAFNCQLSAIVCRIKLRKHGHKNMFNYFMAYSTVMQSITDL